jgi:hypothetical protein
MAAAELAFGDRLVGHDGAEVAVESVEDTGGWATVYNLRVSGFHTYFVGSREWGFSVWVHNAYVAVAQLGDRLGVVENGRYVRVNGTLTPTAQEVADYIIAGRHQLTGVERMNLAQRLALKEALEQAYQVRMQAAGWELDQAINAVTGSRRGMGTRNISKLEQLLLANPDADPVDRAVIQSAIDEFRWMQNMGQLLGNL